MNSNWHRTHTSAAMSDYTALIRPVGRAVLTAFVCFTFLNGCAAYTTPLPGTAHPAHPQAAAAPPRPPSPTLTVRADDTPRDDMSTEMEGTHAMEHDAMPMEGQQTVVGEGTVVALVPGTQQVVIDHEEIEGFMGAMTMGFRVHAPSLLDHVQPGDGVRFTINTATGTIIALEKLTP